MTTPSVISEFKGQYHWLSNFSPSEVTWCGLQFPTVENGYQAAKCQCPTTMHLFKQCTPGQAKRLGKTVLMREDWDAVKRDIMQMFLSQKFQCGTELASKLLATGNASLIEGNYWHDNFWGRCSCTRCQEKTWHNHLGRLLMQIRKGVAS